MCSLREGDGDLILFNGAKQGTLKGICWSEIFAFPSPTRKNFCYRECSRGAVGAALIA